MKSKERDRLVRMEVAHKLKELEADVAKRMAVLVKPAPAWIPQGLYRWMASWFLNL